MYVIKLDLPPHGYLQFKCENGRIILSIKHHEWNKSTFSSEFADASLSSEFVSRYNELVGEPGDTDSQPPEYRPDHTPQVPSRKRPSLPDASGTESDVISVERPSPTKKYKYISGGIDEEIERKRIGMVTVHFSIFSLSVFICLCMCVKGGITP